MTQDKQGSNIVRSTFDFVGNKTSVDYPGSILLACNYDEVDRLRSLVADSTNVCRLSIVHFRARPISSGQTDRSHNITMTMKAGCSILFMGRGVPLLDLNINGTTLIIHRETKRHYGNLQNNLCMMVPIKLLPPVFI